MKVLMKSIMVRWRSPVTPQLGVMEKGSHADVLLVDGDPLSDINLIADPEKNFTIIMKDGVIFKDTRKHPIQPPGCQNLQNARDGIICLPLSAIFC
jgi:hypothetical protein